MQKRSWLIQQEKTEFVIVRLCNGGEVAGRVELRDRSIADSAVVSELASIVHENGYAGEDVLLAIRSKECFVAQFLNDTPPRHIYPLNEEPLYYLLEEHLPISAEDIVADFCRRANHVFSVAISTDDWRPLIFGLREYGVTIASICPFSLLVAQAASAETTTPRVDVAVEQEEHCDSIQLRHGAPYDWQFFRPVPGEIRRHELLAVLALGDASAPPTDASTRLAQQVTFSLDGDFSASNEIFQMVCDFVEAVNAGRKQPWIQLAQRTLLVADTMRGFRLPLNSVLAIALLLASVAMGGGWYRIGEYSDRITWIRSEEEAVFQEAMPNQRVPIGIHSRLQSEFRNLQGLSGSDGVNATHQEDILATLSHVLSRLPKDVRFRLLQFRIDGNEFSVEGEARSHGDADVVGNAIATDGYTLGALTTQQLTDAGVSFRLEGRYTGEAHDAQQ